MKNTEKKLFLVNGVWLVAPKNSLANAESLERFYKRQKLFIRWAKRFMVGPVLGLMIAFVFLQMQQPFWISAIIGSIVGIGGLIAPFKYVKNSYWLVLVILYGFLISQMIVGRF